MTTKRYYRIPELVLSVAVALIAGDAWALENNPPGISVEVGVMEQYGGVPASRGRTGDGAPFFLLSPVLDPIDKVPMLVRLVNTSGQPLYMPDGFSTRKFYLDLVITDPDGKAVVANGLVGSSAPDPPPPPVLPIDGQLVPAEPVQVFERDTSILFELPNAHDYYTLNKPGTYFVNAAIRTRTYPEADYAVGGKLVSLLASSTWSGTLFSETTSFTLAADRDGDGYYAPVEYGYGLDCDDDNPAVNPGAADPCRTCSPPASCAAAQTATLVVRAERHTVGMGDHPPTNKEPIAGMWVRVIDKSAGSCAWTQGISWQFYPAVYALCAPVPGGEGATDASGTATFSVAPGEYLAIGYYDPTPSPSSPGDEIYPGVSAGPLTAGTTSNKYLQVIAKSDGKKVPGKYTLRTGSELMIIEPEYVEWTSTQELYPFIFQTAGEWGVSTSISPPEGFVADHDALSADVVNTLQAVQFTVTDVGSDWVDTKVTHTVRHKGRTEAIRSHVGVRNSKHAPGAPAAGPKGKKK